jgi:NAD(P)-dependent dehydrogenase (short-subunit alcohol dehydrogenase family)
MFKDLINKNVVITGGSGFLGSQIAMAFLKESSNVIIIDIKKPISKSKKIFFFKCNIEKKDEILKTSLLIKKKFKKIHILINNAAVNPVPKKSSIKKFFTSFNINQFKKEISINLISSFLMCKYFGEIMEKQEVGGNIINIASDLSIIAPTQKIYKHLKFLKPVSYSISKHGIIGLTKYIAADFNNHKIRCNAVALGGIFNNQDKKFVRNLQKLIPMNRMAKKNEYNDLILFLSSESSSYMNGATVVADGGRTII